jgi:hypothetical protein
MTSRLYGVQPVDALTYVTVAAALAAVAALASYIPARRAAAVTPLKRSRRSSVAFQPWPLPDERLDSKKVGRSSHAGGPGTFWARSATSGRLQLKVEHESSYSRPLDFEAR